LQSQPPPTAELVKAVDSLLFSWDLQSPLADFTSINHRHYLVRLTGYQLLWCVKVLLVVLETVSAKNLNCFSLWDMQENYIFIL